MLRSLTTPKHGLPDEPWYSLDRVLLGSNMFRLDLDAPLGARRHEAPKLKACTLHTTP